MSSNVGKKCFKLWCVLCAVQFVTEFSVTNWTFNDVFLLSIYSKLYQYSLW
jgi:hypothetical protein